MNVDTAMKIIVKPYITEKTFAMIENENKICFIVDLSAKKPEIAEAVNTLYKQKFPGTAFRLQMDNNARTTKDYRLCLFRINPIRLESTERQDQPKPTQNNPKYI